MDNVFFSDICIAALAVWAVLFVALVLEARFRR